jgi:hypothetical protein
MSADDTIKHWEAAVEAGKNILWDSLSDAMEEIASEVIAEYGKSLEKTERIIISALDDQFERIKTDRESVITEAQQFQQVLKTETDSFSTMQENILINRPGVETRKNE